MTRKSRPEALVERSALAVLGQVPDAKFFKNEVGEGFYGAVRPQIAALLTEHPALRKEVLAVLDRNRVHYGLHVGSADVIGIDGAQGGRLVSFELKSADGRLRPEQEIWRENMRRLGALAEVVRSPAEAMTFLEEARKGKR